MKSGNTNVHLTLPSKSYLRKMKKILTLSLCFFPLLISSRAYSQVSGAQGHSTDPVIIAGIELIVVLGVLYFLVPKKPKEGSNQAERSYLGLGIFGFVLLVMMVTNPSLEDHRQAVMHEMEKDISKSSSGDRSDSWEQLGLQLGESLGRLVLDRVVERENFILFSVSTITIDKSTKDMGFGIFGHVWLLH